MTQLTKVKQNIHEYKDKSYTYSQRLCRLKLQSLELRRLVTDLLWCYKIVFNVVDISTEEFFCYRPNTCSYTRGHPFKLFKKRPVSSTKAIFSVIASLMFGTPCLLPMYTLHLWLYIPSLHSKGRSVRLYKRF